MPREHLNRREEVVHLKLRAEVRQHLKRRLPQGVYGGGGGIFSIGAEERGGLGAAVPVLAAEEVDKLHDLVMAREVLCEEVRGIDISANLSDFESFRPHLLLEP